jgi:peptidoglycan/LPS O-acetylase OafA/YrhL
MEPRPARMSKTSLALHNLRGFAILNVLAFHSFIAYIVSQPPAPLPFDSPPYGWTANPIVDGHRWLGFDLICAFEFLCLMQLMFFLSGLFVWPSLRRKGARMFLQDRLLRVGVPFVLGAGLLMPLAYYPVYRVTAVDPSWSAYWSHWTALPFWPGGPMWFLWFLLALNLAAAGIFRLAPRSGEFLARLASKGATDPGRLFVALVAVLALAYVPVAAVFTPWQWVEFGPFGFQPGPAAQYILFFFAGIGVGAFGIERGLLAADGMLVRRWAFWLAGILASFVLWIVPTGLIVNGHGATLPGLQILADLGAVLFAASACFGLSAASLRFAAARRPVLDGVSEHAYGIYLFHYVFVIWTQYLLLGIALPGIAKGAIVFAVTLALSWAASAALSRVPVAGRVIGAASRSQKSEIRGQKPELGNQTSVL